MRECERVMQLMVCSAFRICEIGVEQFELS
jgi:hypothetical protein